MKRLTFAFSIIALFFIMLFFPKQVVFGASKGLLLWFEVILPTLLPFMIISNLLIHTNSISYISMLVGPVFRKVFHVTPDGSFAILTGFLCGYPMGAKTTADLITTGRISKQEGAYLLSFCNNTSPMFIISYIVLQNLKQEALVLPTLFILFLSPILCSFLFRMYHKPKQALCNPAQISRNNQIQFHFLTLDTCIMNAFETITKVGGYIMLFSVLITLASIIPFSNDILQQFLLPALEITNGIPLILENQTSAQITYVSIVACTSFGGLCSIAQTKSMIQESGLSILPYIIEKLITALVTSLLAFLYWNMFYL